MVSCRRWWLLETDSRIRIEIGFDGGQVLGALVSPESADALEHALAAADVRADAGDAAVALDADDGRYTIALRRVVYMKRFVRDTRVGFGAQAR
jgi:hypothetical protein